MDFNQYFELYIQSYLQIPTLFNIVKNNVTQLMQFEGVRPYFVQINPTEKLLRITGMTEYPIFQDNTLVTQIKMTPLQSEQGETKCVTIQIRGEKTPINLYGPVEAMELWYDGLRILLNRGTPETPSSTQKMKSFEKCIAFCQSDDFGKVEIPPPPEDLSYE